MYSGAMSACKPGVVIHLSRTDLLAQVSGQKDFFRDMHSHIQLIFNSELVISDPSAHIHSLLAEELAGDLGLQGDGEWS